MTDGESDSELEELRRRKLAELQERTDDGPAEGTETATAPDEPVHVEDTDGFEAFVEAHDLVLVDFYADWCGPCKQLEPIVADLAAETDAAVLKVDIDANQRLAASANVRGVPTLVLYADGEPVERVVGVQGKGQLRSLIDRYG